MMKRDSTQKASDYMMAYRTGPAKLWHVPFVDLQEASRRWARLNMEALEQAIQTRIEEEGCGAFFADKLFPQVEAFLPRTGTPCPETD